ncbi:MAG TPA: hypothetical protein VFX05_08370, partial [Casimicrobiaceae bacterium]|nr:hypothetical protein [Casimicrobiaceae bacterium]
MRAARAWTALVLAVAASAAPASVFYKFDVVAQTGQGGIVSLGTGPSVNEKGKVAYIGRYAGGPSVFAWTPSGGSTDLASSFLSSSRNFGEAVMMNFHDEIVTWNRIQPQDLYEVRVFRAGTPNDSSLAVRATTTGQPYNILYQHPAMNANRVLEDRSSQIATGDKDGVCDAGEVCFSQVAFNAFENTPTIARYLGTVVRNPSSAAENGLRNEYALNTSISRPAMADDGRIAVRGAGTANPILLFDHALGAPTTIAGAAQGFTTLGAAPGITPDGKVVAFAGTRGFGTGVFLSIELPGGQRRIVRVAGENGVFKKQELGQDEAGNGLYIATVDVDSRVGVIYTPGRSGAANGAVVVSFVGTPNAQSRQNAATGKPFFFSAQKGLWTVRLDLDAPLYQDQCVVLADGAAGNPFTTRGDDALQSANGQFFVSAGANGICESDDTHDTQTLAARLGPIPVVQVGDRILAHTVANIGVHDPIAPANFTDAQTPRATRLGDHRVAFWADVGAGAQLIVRGEQLDSDQDGLYDHWETTGIDLEGTGVVDLDLAAMGADPFVRDLFVQMDWVADYAAPLNVPARHRPLPGVIRRLAQFFAAAPAMPSGVPAGIRLHVDAGPWVDSANQALSRDMGNASLRGGKQVWPTPLDIVNFGAPGSLVMPGVATRSLAEVKDANLWNSERGARQFAFSYVLWSNFYEPATNNGLAIYGTATGGDAWLLADANNPMLATAEGMGIKITAGSGAGQVRAVAYSGQDGAGSPYVEVDEAWTVPLDNTSQYTLFKGNGGASAVGFRPDGGYAPGKDMLVTLGSFGVSPPALEQANFTSQWKMLAHELGHLFTFPHGGVDEVNYKPDYVSIMNYAYSECLTGVGADEDGNPLPGAAPCPVNSYAGSGDAVHDDWAAIDMASGASFLAAASALGTRRDPATFPFPPDLDQQTLVEIERQFGPLDRTVPAVVPSSPAGGAAVSLGAGIAVSFGATDPSGIARAEVLFDVNGDGRIAEPGEVFAATAGGGGFSASIPSVSGPAGARRLAMAAYDGVG